MAIALARLRELAGLTQTELSRAAEVSVSHLANIEAGRTTPGVDLAMRLVEVLRSAPMAGLKAEDVSTFSSAARKSDSAAS